VRHATVTLLAVLAALGCSPEADLREEVEPTSPSAEVPNEQPPQVAALAFGKPGTVCTALAGEGFSSVMQSTWDNSDGVGYACGGDPLEVTKGGYQYVGDIANTVTYYAESETKNQVEMIRLTANIFNEKREQPVIDKLEQLATTLFDRLDIAVPRGLVAAIEQGEPKTYREDYGTVSLAREKYNRGYGLILTIEEASHLEAVAALKDRSSGSFEQCRETIAKVKGYPLDKVTGDGKPTRGDTGLSFLIEGPSDDLFFCEVAPDGRYAIKGGNFSDGFQQVASGTFE